MKDVMDLIFEYRRLIARRDVMAVDLSVPARARLAGLEKLFGGGNDNVAANDDGTRRRRHARVEVNIPATVRVGDRVHSVQIVNVGGGGLCIEPAMDLRQGELAILRVVSSDAGRIYQYEVEASWVDDGPERSAVGMPFIGIPRELPLAKAS
jgi:hypothetical protein